MFTQTKNNLHSVTMLRGIASLGVCIAHFTGTVSSKLIQHAGNYGTWGVSLFFVISGFIIPYSLYYSNYKLKNYPYFILKRIIRLDPPYILSILGIFLLSCLAQLSPYHTSNIINLFNANTLYHIFYVVDILKGQWFNGAFWTLAIEFQFYILIGLLFPLLTFKNNLIQLLLFLLFCSIPFFIPDNRFVTSYLLMFLPGILLFFLMTKQISLPIFIFSAIIIVALNYIKTDIQGLICPIIAAGFILFIKKPIKPLIFLGTISYSLYLINTPIGTDGIINFLQNYIISENGRIGLMIIALLIIIFFAWVFYRVIEKPSLKLSKKIVFRN